MEEASPDESAVLMRRVQEGDQEAFATLVGLHQQTLVNMAYRMLGNLEDAQDCAQQAFCRIWKSAHRYEPNAKFSSWMFTILRNLVYNEFRRRQRQAADSLDAKVEETGFQVPDASTPNASQAADQQELEQTLDEAIGALPENQRLALTLWRFQDLSYEEIAAVLDTSVSSVKSLLFRARTTLKEKLQAYLDA